MNTIVLNEKRKRIEIHFEYRASYVMMVKTIPGRRFHPGEPKHWYVPASAYHAREVIAVFGRVKGWEIDDKVKELSKQDEKAIEASQKTTARRMKDLYPFQSAGVAFLRAVNGRGLVADDMGLGKTVQALVYLREEQANTPGLIIVPASVVYKWKQEIDKWWPDVSSEIVTGSKGDLPHAQVLIMSYSIATRRYAQLALRDNGFIVFDEIHYLKNHKTQRVRAARAYINGVKHIIGLSGTPFLNRPKELFNILHLIDPLTWNSYFDYAMRYCGAWQDNYGHWVFDGISNQEELASRLESVMIRRLKADVLDQLPDLQRVIVPVKVSRQKYTKTYNSIADLTTENPLVKLNYARQTVGILKVDPAVEWARNFLESTDEKLVIYAHHKRNIDAIVEGLKDYKVETITGSTPQAKRQKNVDAFQTKPYPRVMVISSAAGEGIDLYKASNILFVEREWSPLYEEQVEARLHRIGQDNAVTAYYLSVIGTVDEDMAELIDTKRQYFKEIVSATDIETIVKEMLIDGK